MPCYSSWLTRPIVMPKHKPCTAFGEVRCVQCTKAIQLIANGNDITWVVPLVIEEWP